MWRLLDWLRSFFIESGPEADASPTWYWIKIVICVVVGLGMLKLIFVFSVPQSYTGFMKLGEKIVRRSMKPGWYPQVPFIYSGNLVYLGVQTLPFEEETRSKDQALLVVKGAMHFRVIAAEAAKYRYEVGEGNPLPVLKERLLSAMRSAVSSALAAESFEHKDKIAQAVMDHLAESLRRDAGIEVVEVPITEVSPHKEVAAAFNAVQAAQRRVDEAAALATVKKTEAEGDATAMEIRARGQASQIGEQAEGLLTMLATLTGKPLIELPTEAAIFVMTQFLGMQMRTAFATSGKATAMVIPDDAGILKEVTDLLPTLVAHTAVDEAGSGDSHERALQLLEGKAGADDGAKQAVKATSNWCQPLLSESPESDRPSRICQF